jgi:serine/threonine-protein kinase
MQLTRDNHAMGTPYYMAPEQAKGSRELDHRVDLYAAGVILYEAVTGEVPFNADTFNELLFKIVLEAARPVEQVVQGIDPAFAAIVNKSMAREPNARFQTAREFQEALDQWAAGAGPQLAAALNASTQASAGQARPPMPSAHGTGQFPAAPAHTLGTGTPGTWSGTMSGGVTPPPKKSNAGLFIGLAAAAVVVLGGGAFVAKSLSQGKADAAAAIGKAEADVDKARAEQALREKASQEANDKAKAEADKAKAQAEAMMSEAEKAKAAAADAAAKNAKAAAAAPVAVRNVRPAPTPKAEPKPEPKPAAAPAPATTGRRIRTQL